MDLATVGQEQKQQIEDVHKLYRHRPLVCKKRPAASVPYFILAFGLFWTILSLSARMRSLLLFTYGQVGFRVMLLYDRRLGRVGLTYNG